MMIHLRRRQWFWAGLVLWIAAVGSTCPSRADEPASIEFTLSARRAAEQRYDVEMRCGGVTGESLDFSLPVWTPGYYQLMNYAKQIENFTATDDAGRSLAWEQVDGNTWRVATAGATDVVLKYAVHAPKDFIAENALGRDQGYIVPTATFMHPVGHLKQPVTLKVKPLATWSDIATGLEPVHGEQHVFAAADFDELYDCPLLVGELERIDFEVQGIPHAFVGRNLGMFDRGEFVTRLTRMIEAASAIVGEIPYRHYTILAVGPMMGGIEHANSTAISFEGGRTRSPTRDPHFLRFVTHEYFHLYNAKRIRPIELGPFDYERECPTRMLWVAEGFTVYYEHVILKRAGLVKRQDLFDSLRSSIVAYERRPGRLKQSAAAASFATWREGPFGAGDDTISCYDKGAALGMLLDFKIRHETQNAKSLDDVMRTLYREFHVAQGRGYTEDEFRRVCEETAGCDLEEFFDYATTTCEIDYPKYLGYAGLAIEMPGEMPGDGPRDKAFQIKPLENPTELQRRILAAWLGEHRSIEDDLHTRSRAR